MKTKNLVAGAVASLCLTFALPMHAEENKGEAVDQKNLPAAVISGKAAGGEIVRMQREDDKNGRWNYEVIVKKTAKSGALRLIPTGITCESTMTSPRQPRNNADTHGSEASPPFRTIL